MPLRLPILALCGVLVITAAGFALHQYQRAEKLATALATQSEHSVELATELEEAKSENQTLSAELARRGDQTSATAAPAPTAAAINESSTTSGDSRSRNSWGRMFQELLSDPTYARAYQLQQRSTLDTRYADLFAQLDLSPQELENLQTLLVEKMNAPRDVFTAAREAGLNRNDRDQVRALLESTRSEIDEEIRDYLGEDNYAALKRYEGSQTQRAALDQLERRLSYTGTELNTMQSQALLNIFSAGAEPSGTQAWGPWGGEASWQITDDVITQARGILAPNQMAALEELQAEQQAARELQQAMRSLRQNARTATPPSGGG